MLRALASRRLPIIFHNNGTLIAIMQTIIFDIVALCSNEIIGPTCFCHEFIKDHNFRLRGDFCVKIMFVGSNNG